MRMSVRTPCADLGKVKDLCLCEGELRKKSLAHEETITLNKILQDQVIFFCFLRTEKS